jgi:hypothetical protein
MELLLGIVWSYHCAEVTTGALVAAAKHCNEVLERGMLAELQFSRLLRILE